MRQEVIFSDQGSSRFTAVLFPSDNAIAQIYVWSKCILNISLTELVNFFLPLPLDNGCDSFVISCVCCKLDWKDMHNGESSVCVCGGGLVCINTCLCLWLCIHVINRVWSQECKVEWGTVTSGALADRTVLVK